MHVRALALDRATHEAVGGRKLIFELEDSRGNKVFKKVTATDGYGVASTEFSLADEVNLGTYHLRALLEESNKSEIALQVERYVLPKFKVAVDFTGSDSKTSVAIVLAIMLPERSAPTTSSESRSMAPKSRLKHRRWTLPYLTPALPKGRPTTMAHFD